VDSGLRRLAGEFSMRGCGEPFGLARSSRVWKTRPAAGEMNLLGVRRTGEPMKQERTEQPELPERWSAKRKAEVMMRLVRGEDLGEVSREIQVPPRSSRTRRSSSRSGRY
jgi:hypothetical protein